MAVETLWKSRTRDRAAQDNPSRFRQLRALYPCRFDTGARGKSTRNGDDRILEFETRVPEAGGDYHSPRRAFNTSIRLSCKPSRGEWVSRGGFPLQLPGLLAAALRLDTVGSLSYHAGFIDGSTAVKPSESP